jgi:integrase/recombinase XerD
MTKLPKGVIVTPDGTLKVRITVNGRKRTTSLHSKVWTTRVERHYHTIMAEVGDTRAGYGPANVPTFTFDAWCDLYEANVTAFRRSPHSTRRAVALALPEWTKRSLVDITPQMCQGFWTRLLRTRITVGKRVGIMAPSTARLYAVQLKAIFEHAVKQGHLAKNPWNSVDVGGPPVKTRVLTLDEQDKLLAILSPYYQRWTRFMLGTGLRLAEATSLVPAQFDVEHELIRDVVGKGPKLRSIPLFEGARLAAEEQLEATPGLLWPRAHSIVQETLRDACKAAGVPHASPHALRHTFATRYLQGGGDIYILSKILGHYSVKTTEKCYAHLLHQDIVELSRGINLGIEPRAKSKVLTFGTRTR